MTIPRKYAVSEIKELVDIFLDDPDTSMEIYAGMQKVVQLLAYFENMTNEEIEAEMRNSLRSQKL